MPKTDLLNRLANTLVVGAIFCTLMYVISTINVEASPALIFGGGLLLTVIPAWYILK